MRIMLVEDDYFYSQMVAELLIDRGLDIIRVSDAQNALAHDITDVDAAVIDLMLPNIPDETGITVEESRAGFYTGVCVARRLSQRNKALKVVLLTSDMYAADAESWAQQHAAQFVRKDDRFQSLLRALDNLGLTAPGRKPLAFIVHGRDEVAVLQLKNFLQNTLQWQEPIVLREQPGAGKTIIEKFEELGAKADYVFVLLTPDDSALTPNSDSQRRRSRQNVIFELGYFYALLGRRSGRVLLLYKAPLELPSDIVGISYIDVSGGIEASGEQIRRELSIIKQSPIAPS